MRKFQLVPALGLALTLSMAVAAPAGAASARTAPPLTSLRVCTMFPGQVVAQKLGKHTTPSASYIPSKTTTRNSYATCFYHFGTAYYVNIELYGPPHPAVTKAGTKVAALGPTGRESISGGTILVTTLSHGYELTVVGPKASLRASALIALAVYVTKNLP